MGTLQERGLDLAARLAPGAAGGRIIYQRGSDSVSIDAVYGRSEFQVETAEGVRIEYTDRDFIVPAERLLLAGELATPARGDRITLVSEDASQDGQVFEVLAPGGAQVYRLSDPQGHLIRIHSKRLS